MRPFQDLLPRLFRSPSGLALGLALGSVILLSACNAQIYPKPMEKVSKTLPPGAIASWSTGPEEVTVVRHADPVRLRTPGATAGFPVRFYEKSQRARAGTGVIASAGGKVEVVWPLGTSVMMYGPATGVVGSTSRGEPTFVFEELGRAKLELLEGDVVRLVGGAILSGSSGPYLVELVRSEILQVTNQSKLPLMVNFRSESFELGPGQRVDLPLLSSGGRPLPGDEGFSSVAGPGFGVSVRGDLRTNASSNAVELSAGGPNEVQALGVRLQLPAGQSATFMGLGESREEDLPEPEAPATPELPASPNLSESPESVG